MSLKGSVQYRFSYETNENFKTVEFDVDRINVAELKILIAQACGLQKEFARTFDLRLTLLSAEGVTDKAEDGLADTRFVPSGSRIMVQRVAWLQRPSIEHSAQTELPKSAWSDAISSTLKKKRPFPPEFICPLCHLGLDHPVVVRCVSKCGKSACRRCVDSRFKLQRLCPFCQERVQNVIPNKALAAIISQLNFDDFELPVDTVSIPAAETAEAMIDSGGLIKVDEGLPALKMEEVPNLSSKLKSFNLKPQWSVTGSGILDQHSAFFSAVPNKGWSEKVIVEELHSDCFLEPKLDAELEDTVMKQEAAPSRERLYSTLPTAEANLVNALLSNPLLKNLSVALSKKAHLSQSTPQSASHPAQSTISNELNPQPHSACVPSIPLNPNQTSNNVLLMQPCVTVQPTVSCSLSNAAPSMLSSNSSYAPSISASILPSLTAPQSAVKSSSTLKNYQTTPSAPIGQRMNLGSTLSTTSNSLRKDIVVAAVPSRMAKGVGSGSQFEFDELTNSWRPIAKTSLNDKVETKVVKSEEFPLTINDLASQFPILSRKDFFIMKNFQRQLKTALRKCSPKGN